MVNVLENGAIANWMLVFHCFIFKRILAHRKLAFQGEARTEYIALTSSFLWTRSFYYERALIYV